MSIWTTAHGLLNSSVVGHLGEELVIADATSDDQVTVRGVLTRSEELVRIGLASMVAGDARLTLHTAHVPVWMGRGDTVTPTASSQTYEVVSYTDNGEGLTEVELGRVS